MLVDGVVATEDVLVGLVVIGPVVEELELDGVDTGVLVGVTITDVEVEDTVVVVVTAVSDLRQEQTSCAEL